MVSRENAVAVFFYCMFYKNDRQPVYRRIAPVNIITIGFNPLIKQRVREEPFLFFIHI